jgi:hypothetical protein
MGGLAMNPHAFRRRGDLSVGGGSDGRTARASVSPAVAAVLLPLAAAAAVTLCAALLGYALFTLLWRTSRMLARATKRRRGETEVGAADVDVVVARPVQIRPAPGPVVAPAETLFATAA